MLLATMMIYSYIRYDGLISIERAKRTLAIQIVRPAFFLVFKQLAFNKNYFLSSDMSRVHNFGRKLKF